METSHKSSKGKMIASGIIPFVFLVILTAYVFGPGSELLDLGVPLPEISMELIDFVIIPVLTENISEVPSSPPSI